MELVKSELVEYDFTCLIMHACGWYFEQLFCIKYSVGRHFTFESRVWFYLLNNVCLYLFTSDGQYIDSLWSRSTNDWWLTEINYGKCTEMFLCLKTYASYKWTIWIRRGWHVSHSCDSSSLFCCCWCQCTEPSSWVSNKICLLVKTFWDNFHSIICTGKFYRKRLWKEPTRSL